MEASGGLVEAVVPLALASAGLVATERLRLPSIVGFLVVGAIAGPGALGIASGATAGIFGGAARSVVLTLGKADA